MSSAIMYNNLFNIGVKDHFLVLICWKAAPDKKKKEDQNQSPQANTFNLSTTQLGARWC